MLASNTPALERLLLLPSDGKLDVPQLILLAAYGLTFCYVASAPILVLHASRFLIEFDPKKANQTSQHWVRLIIMILPPLLAALLATWISKPEPTDVAIYIFVFTFLAVGLVWIQLIGLWFCVFRSKQLYLFYKNLTSKRQLGGDLVESYRHLREHGNSFFIVLLEIVLGLILLAVSFLVPASNTNHAEYYSWVALVMLFWMTPAAVIWLVGTLLERHMIDAP